MALACTTISPKKMGTGGETRMEKKCAIKYGHKSEMNYYRKQKVILENRPFLAGGEAQWQRLT
jgi:hypothetical protein